MFRVLRTVNINGFAVIAFVIMIGLLAVIIRNTQISNCRANRDACIHDGKDSNECMQTYENCLK